MEEAISQLQDLGVTRGQAKQALARYNNDVALAADYIFSGANLSDEEIEPNEPNLTENLFKETIPTNQNSVQLDKKEAAVHQTSYDVSKWGIVPFTPDEKPSQPLSLTWWKDPEDPTERLASPHIPIGLRPPSYHFAYAPIIIQALFHVTAFQQAVLSFRPLPYTWKSPKNYWKGFGEPVPNYRMHPKQSTSSHSPKEAQLIALDSPDSLPIDQLTLTETTVDQVEEEQELEKMSFSMQALAELQRLFAFLGNTQRQYGSVSHFVRALNAKEEADAWGNNEKSFEAFLDMLILCLVQVDEQSEKAIEMDYKPIFRNLFVLKAHIEDDDDYEEEEVYYLSIGLGHTMNSFHACLDPLVFDPSVNNTYKFTTFKQVPPLLWVILENRTEQMDYTVDKTIYLDRYLQSKKQRALEEFIQMDSYTKELVQLEDKMNRIKHDQGRDKLTILKNACSYFEQTDRQGLVSVLTSVQQAIQDQLAELESQKANIKDKMSTLFSSEEMKQCPYDVRATFHHDGKSGTGHYWAYIYVEPSEISLLEDIPAKEEGGWFKFCDASVSPVSEDALWNDPVAPFAMLYADRSIQRWTKDQLKACLPESLNEFIQEDHALLEQEIKDYQQPPPPQEMVLMNETPSPPPLLSLEEPEEDEKYMFTGEGFNQLKTKVNEAISFAHTLAKDDAVFLKKFEAFLARSQNHAALEHLYLLYSSEEGVNEEASKQDDELELIWTEYNHYIDLGKYMVEALDWFVKKDYSHAIDSLLAVKRQEAQWKTRLMLDQGMSDAYPGLETLSFQDLVTSFGQHALKALNDLVFAKAINPAYRFSGLQDGVRVAQQAQSMMGPDTEQEEVYQSLQNQWLSFTDQIKDELTEEEANLLNTLIMTWIEGGSENEKIDSVPVISSDLPLWQKYQQLRETSELILSFQQ